MNEILYTLLLTHITIICVTVYLHRGMTHKGLEFHPILSHFMRFWLWLTTGMVTKQWVAVHRKHHQYTDQKKDPHSPQHVPFFTILFLGWVLYMLESRHKPFVNAYTKDIEEDWLETNIYTKFNWVGIFIMLTIDILLFGGIGVLIWIIQMIWIPFWAAGVINGVGHYFGYRNGETRDASRNIFPVGIVIGGEEFHNNHHLDPANSKLSKKWWEFDIGWMYINIFKSLNLLRIK
jgi:stearoyl-CoA desaturase (Delta-9 desaturase)